MISKESLEKFKKIYKARFNIELSDQDASDKAIRLRRTVEITYKPITVKEYEALQKRREELKKI